MLTLNAEGKTGSDAVEFVKDSVSKSENANEYEFKIIIDRPDQSDEITRYLTSEGFSVMLEDDEGTMFLLASKPRPQQDENEKENDSEAEPEPESESDIKLQDLLTPDKEDSKIKPEIKTPKKLEVIKHTVIKDSAAVILSYESKKYMPSFTAKIIASLNKAKIKPDVIVLMNNAVSLAAYNSQVCNELRELESLGVEILISESCADRMGVTEALGAGVLSDMSEIFETIFSCEKVISL